MSLSATRLASTIVAELKANGFNLDGAPEMGSTGKSGVEVMVDALAAGTVTELEDNWDGEGGGGTSSDAAVTYVQSAPATVWGPGAGGIPHSFGRRAVVEVFDSAGTRWFTSHQEPTVGLVLISWPEPRTGSVVLR